MLNKYIVVNSMGGVSISAGRLGNEYCVLAKSGLAAIVAYMRDGGVTRYSTLAYQIEHFQDAEEYTCRLNGEDLIMSNGVDIYVLLPDCRVEQPKLPF